MPPLALTISATTGARYVPFLHRHLPRAHRLLGSKLRELSVAVVGDKRMTQLHREFLTLDGPTDVLSFPLEFDSRGNVIGGEIVVCLPQARRQARKSGIAVADELLLYALHGLLHLCGFDDRTPLTYRAMHAQEDLILRRLGIGPIFAGSGDAP